MLVIDYIKKLKALKTLSFLIGILDFTGHYFHKINIIYKYYFIFKNILFYIFKNIQYKKYNFILEKYYYKI